MHIDGSGSITSLIQGAKEGGKPQETVNNGPQQQVTKTGQSDMVTLTDTAAQMQRLEHAIAASPIVNSHRVEEVQQAVNDGQMDIDPAQLADRMLSFEGALNGARRGV
jgi:negative regulator of flagellin synthesis FlgM